MPLRRLLRTAHTLRRKLKRETRSAYHCYRQGLSERQRLLELTSEQRDEYLLSALHEAVRRAAEVPFWRKRFESVGFDWNGQFDFGDYAKIPPLDRSEVADAGDALLSARVPAGQRRKMATGGSSGTPTVTWTGPLERGWGESGARFYENLIGFEDGHRVALLWGHNLDPVARASIRDRVEDWMLNRKWYDCFRLSHDVLMGYHHDLCDFRPHFVQAYASALASLAEAIRKEGLPTPPYPIIGFITGAEKVYDWQREIIETVFNRPVYERYGGRDIGLIGVQLQPQRSVSFHIDWPNVYLEVDQDAGGELLVTKLHADAMPMLRYRTGDLVVVSSSHAQPIVTIDEVVGRTLQRIWLPGGKWMHGTVVPHLLKDFPLDKYQLRQAADRSAKLLLVVREEFTPDHEHEIRQALEQNLPGLTFGIERVDMIESTRAGKWLPVVSEVSLPMEVAR